MTRLCKTVEDEERLLRVELWGLLDRFIAISIYESSIKAIARPGNRSIDFIFRCCAAACFYGKWLYSKVQNKNAP